MLIDPVGQRTVNMFRERKHAPSTDNSCEIEGNLGQWKHLGVVGLLCRMRMDCRYTLPGRKSTLRADANNSCEYAAQKWPNSGVVLEAPRKSGPGALCVAQSRQALHAKTIRGER